MLYFDVKKLLSTGEYYERYNASVGTMGVLCPGACTDNGVTVNAMSKANPEMGLWDASVVITETPGHEYRLVVGGHTESNGNGYFVRAEFNSDGKLEAIGYVAPNYPDCASLETIQEVFGDIEILDMYVEPVSHESSKYLESVFGSVLHK